MACLLCWRGPAGVAHVEEAEGDRVLVCGLPLHATVIDCPGVDAGRGPRLEPAQPEAVSVQGLCKRACNSSTVSSWHPLGLSAEESMLLSCRTELLKGDNCHGTQRSPIPLHRFSPSCCATNRGSFLNKSCLTPCQTVQQPAKAELYPRRSLPSHRLHRWHARPGWAPALSWRPPRWRPWRACGLPACSGSQCESHPAERCLS